MTILALIKRIIRKSIRQIKILVAPIERGILLITSSLHTLKTRQEIRGLLNIMKRKINVKKIVRKIVDVKKAKILFIIHSIASKVKRGDK